MEVVNTVMQWVVAPIAWFVWALYNKLQNLETKYAVMNATQAANKEAHDREFKEVKASFQKVLDKLDSIETHMRK